MLKNFRKKIGRIIELFLTDFLHKDPNFLTKYYKYILRVLFQWNLKEVNHQDDGTFLYLDNSNDKIIYSRKSRVFRYKNGIESKLYSLQLEYLTNNLILPKESVIIDIGANIGEYSLFWKRKGFNVISFEPEKLEFLALKKNLASELSFNCGLWFEESTLEFYHRNESGDSSFIADNSSASPSKLQVKPLDSFGFHHNLNIGLIKLEAEGAEPEIIRGGVETFKKASFITCDVGLERGISNSSTIVEVTNLLHDLGFELINFNPKRYSVLFKNTFATAKIDG